jgi:hypothetical protein
MCKVVPVPIATGSGSGPKLFFWLGPGPENAGVAHLYASILTLLENHMEFFTSKCIIKRDTRIKNVFWSGIKRFFSDRDQNFFSTGTGTRLGPKCFFSSGSERDRDQKTLVPPISNYATSGEIGQKLAKIVKNHSFSPVFNPYDPYTHLFISQFNTEL